MGFQFTGHGSPPLLRSLSESDFRSAKGMKYATRLSYDSASSAFVSAVLPPFARSGQGEREKRHGSRCGGKGLIARKCDKAQGKRFVETRNLCTRRDGGGGGGGGGIRKK